MSRSVLAQRLRPALALAVVLSVAACASSPDPASPTTSSPVPPVGATSAPFEPPPTPPVESATPTSAAIPLLGSLPTGPLDAATSARLQVVIDEIVANGQPDVIAAVITAEGTWAGAAGTVGPDGRPATPDDVFALASVSKPVIAALMLRLEELGMVHLDAPLSTYIGKLDVDTNEATLRDALSMRGGFGETDGAVVDEALADCARAWTRDEVLDALPATVGTAGDRFSYSNPGYKLVGYVAEAVTGVSLTEAIRTYVVEPVGIERLILQGPEAATPGPWALPLEANAGPIPLTEYGSGGTLPCLSDSTLSVAGTAMAGDAMSTARWAWALFGGSIINEASLASMTDIDDDDYGLGIWRFTDFPPHLAFGHAGNKPGFAPLLAVLPERQVVVVVCINDQDADPYRPARRLLEALD